MVRLTRSNDVSITLITGLELFIVAQALLDNLIGNLTCVESYKEGEAGQLHRGEGNGQYHKVNCEVPNIGQEAMLLETR